ncbi:hypothetical protein N2152v2_001466 [Parachlorella kessleri]
MVWLFRTAEARSPPANRPQQVLLYASAQGSSSSGTASNSRHSSKPATPLQQRLAKAGVADWQNFGSPRYSDLAGEPEVSAAAARILELHQEGLAADDMERLLQQPGSPWSCDLQAVFLPNIAFLRGLLLSSDNAKAFRGMDGSGRTLLGHLLCENPACLAGVLTSRPAQLGELQAWLCGEIGLSIDQVAYEVGRRPSFLLWPLYAAQECFVYLTQELRVTAGKGAELLLDSRVFESSPGSLARRSSQMAQALNLSSVSALGPLVSKVSSILWVAPEAVGPLAKNLDEMFDQKGAGVDFLELKVLCAYEHLGPAVARFRYMDGFDQYELACMASRLAFMRHLGLPNPDDLILVGKFLENVLAAGGKAAGREGSPDEFVGWVADLWQSREWNIGGMGEAVVDAECWLLGLGAGDAHARELAVKYCKMLTEESGSPSRQLKLLWAYEHLGSAAEKLRYMDGFERNGLQRMASRLAFMRHLGLPDPSDLMLIARNRDSTFLAAMGKAAGREVSPSEFWEWVAEWLRTPEGKLWGVGVERPYVPSKRPTIFYSRGQGRRKWYRGPSHSAAW